MVSFASLYEQMEKERISPLMDSGEENKSMIIVRKGNQLRKEGDRPFWDDFIDLCGDSQSLSSLLQVEQQKIMKWPTRIREMLEKLKQHEAEDPARREEDEVIATGNQDPQLGL